MCVCVCMYVCVLSTLPTHSQLLSFKLKFYRNLAIFHRKQDIS